jgi:phosphopantetheinyl transferase (holo-ACP synthase)
MSPGWHLGNDVVDLTDPRHSGKARDERFLLRVFSEEEKEGIRASANPDLSLWMCWAGKEAAFKTISKALGKPPVFVHTLFTVAFQRTAGSHSGKRRSPVHPMTHFGEVRHEGHVLPLRVEVMEGKLHAVTWSPSPSGALPPFIWGSSEITDGFGRWKETLRPSFSTREWECISHRASALARMAARDSIASALGVEERNVEIACGPGSPGRRIPKVLLGGKEIPVDLSLSHHGRLLAWAFLTHQAP